VYPEFLATFWSWKHLLKFVAKKSAFPPLGLLTIAAMLPEDWEKRVVDLNVRKLTDEDIKWADFVFVSAMIAQKNSAVEIIERCQVLGAPVVLGGPILETEDSCKEFPSVEHFFLGEAEETLPGFLSDLQASQEKRVYSSERFPDIEISPIPLYRLIDPKDYASGFAQFSRGCPFECTFCNIAHLNGRKWRSKSPNRFLAGIDAMHQAGFRGAVQIADDNFVGKIAKTKEMLSALILWQNARGYPFEFTIEAPVIIADDAELMDLMAQANVKKVFLGLETDNPECLAECQKKQNLHRDLVADVKRIQSSGLIPMSGFIVGFDSDHPDSFVEKMIDFIGQSGICMAMVDVLQAQPGTKLYEKLKQQGRLLRASVSNTDCYPNFIPMMPVETLANGYKKILQKIYSPKEYYKRIREFVSEYDSSKRPRIKITMWDFRAFMRANVWIGILGGPKVSYYYWLSIFTTVFSKKWRALSDVVALQIYRFHFGKVTEEIVNA